ncbi:MAG: ATP-binding protein [Mangrovibacterium sp.]
MIAVYLFFLFCVVLLAVLEPYFNGKNLLSATQNKFFFTLNFAVITTYIFLFAGYAQHLFTRLERREAERQKEINDAKTRLYTNITHEFRTPLTVILGLAESLKENSSDTRYAKAETIIRNGKNLLQLVDQMLDLSKLESGNLTVNKIHGNIIPFLRYIFQLQEYYAQEKNLQFIFESESQSYELDFDPEKITTIVSNLLSNAIKFTPPGGRVNMRVKAVGNYLSIEIIDNGIGIPKEQQEKIFERFYQVDDQDTRKAGGTGIGLALAKELVTLLNGTIILTSNPGNETVFTVKLPVTSLAKKKFVTEEMVDEESGIQSGYSTSEQSISPINNNGKQKLLIIEDNLDVVSYLKSCYQSHFSIDIAVNGNEGYAMAIETIPDLIISDIMMPGMDGFTLCKKLKEDYRTSHIPIILLTAKADIPSRIMGLEQGADAYVVKPFNQQELLVRINKLLELRRKLYLRYSNGEPSDISDNPILQREDQFFRKVTENVKKNLHDENYDVRVLCREMAMSKSQLYRKFKALTNLSAAKYIRKLRMEKARQLLLTSPMNVTEVSYEVGIKTLSTFSEIFKEEFGLSPTEYLHHNQEKPPFKGR